MNAFARFLSGKNITPNQISITSTFFATLSAVCFLLFTRNENWWLLILSGYVIYIVSYGEELGWCTGLLAMLTFACILTALEIVLWKFDYVLLVTIGLIIVGCVITRIRRAISSYRFLES